MCGRCNSTVSFSVGFRDDVVAPHRHVRSKIFVVEIVIDHDGWLKRSSCHDRDKPGDVKCSKAPHFCA